MRRLDKLPYSPFPDIFEIWKGCIVTENDSTLEQMLPCWTNWSGLQLVPSFRDDSWERGLVVVGCVVGGGRNLFPLSPFLRNPWSTQELSCACMRLQEVLTVVCICSMIALKVCISQDQWMLCIRGGFCCEIEGTVTLSKAKWPVWPECPKTTNLSS